MNPWVTNSGVLVPTAWAARLRAFQYAECWSGLLLLVRLSLRHWGWLTSYAAFALYWSLSSAIEAIVAIELYASGVPVTFGRGTLLLNR
jgi:hypothetical protein